MSKDDDGRRRSEAAAAATRSRAIVSARSGSYTQGHSSDFLPAAKIGGRLLVAADMHSEREF